MSAVLPPADAERVDAEGEQISIAEYEARRRTAPPNPARLKPPVSASAD